MEAVIQAASGLWEQPAADVPEWAAQELTFGQMRLLFLLSKHGPSPMSRIAEWLGVGLPTASGTVDRVERHGLVERRHRVDDRRVVECQLTARRPRAPGGDRRHAARHDAPALSVLTGDELGEIARLMLLILERTKSVGA